MKENCVTKSSKYYSFGKYIIVGFIILFAAVIYYRAVSFVSNYSPEILNEVKLSGKMVDGFQYNGGVWYTTEYVEDEYVGSYSEINNEMAVYESGWYQAGGDISVKISGYAGNEAIDLYVETDHGKKIECNLSPGEVWQEWIFRIGTEKKFRFVVKDNASEGFDWIGITTHPYNYSNTYILAKEYIRVIRMIGMIGIVFLWFIPGYAISIVICCKLNSFQYTNVLSVVISVVVSLIFFWIRVYSGVDMRIAILFFGGFLLILSLYYLVNLKQSDLILQSHKFLYEFGFIFLIAVFYIAILNLYDLQPAYSPLWMARRFKPTVDNEFQYALVQKILNNESLNSSLLGWQTSDRPPLLAACFYFISTFVGDKYYEDLYLVQAIVLNLSVWFIIFIFLRKCSSNQKKWLTIIFTFSFTVCVNMIVTWAKFVSCLFFFFSLMLLFKWYKNQSLLRIEQILVGGSIALSMLSHGSIAFAILSLGIVLLVKGKVRWKEVPCIGLVFLILYLPWIYFQKIIAPPGDLLLRGYFAGIWENNGTGIFEQVILSYRRLTISQWIKNKLENVLAFLITGVGTGASWHSKLHWFWWQKWSALFFTFGINNIVWLTNCKKIEDNNECKYLKNLFIVSLIVSVLLYFNGGDTIIHQCAYSNIIVLIMLGCYRIDMLPIRLVKLINIINIIDILLTILIKPDIKYINPAYSEIFYGINYIAVIFGVLFMGLLLFQINRITNIEKEK